MDFFTSITTFRDIGFLTDVTINIICPQFENKTIKAHRLVLSAKCDYFKKLFMSNTKEAQTGVIEMEVSDGYLLIDLINEFYEHKSNSGNYDQWQWTLKMIILKDYLAIPHNYNLFKIEGTIKDYESLFKVAEIYQYNSYIKDVIFRNISSEIDLSQIEELKGSFGYLMLESYDSFLIYFINDSSLIFFKEIKSRDDFKNCMSCHSIVAHTNLGEYSIYNIIRFEEKKYHSAFKLYDVSDKFMVKQYKCYGLEISKDDKIIYQNNDRGSRCSKISPDETFVVALFSDDIIFVCDLENKQEKSGFAGICFSNKSSLEILKDNRIIILEQNHLKIFDRDLTILYSRTNVNHYCFSWDCQYLVLVDKSKTIYIYDKNYQKIREHKMDIEINAISCFPDNNMKYFVYERISHIGIEPGATILSGNRDPLLVDGKNRDFFINNATKEYFKKIFGSWVLMGNSYGLDPRKNRIYLFDFMTQTKQLIINLSRSVTNMRTVVHNF